MRTSSKSHNVQIDVLGMGLFLIYCLILILTTLFPVSTAKGFKTNKIFSLKAQQSKATYYIDGGTSSCGVEINPDRQQLVSVSGLWSFGTPNPNNDPICKE